MSFKRFPGLSFLLRCFLSVWLVFAYPVGSAALENPDDSLKEVGLSTQLGSSIDTSLEFVGTDGVSRPLSDYLKGDRPTLLVPAYYDCPRLCGLLLEGVQDLLEKLQLSLGEDYGVVTVSFDPEDSPESARAIQKRFAHPLQEDVGDSSEWVFLSGDQGNITPLMKQLGFHYREDKGEFAHTAAIFVTTPQGQIAQYFAGISFPFRDVRLSLVEAGKGQIGTVLDHVLLYCFRFDPTEGKYTLAAFNVMRAGGGLTLLFLTGLIVWLRKREKKTLSESEDT